jgi:hypothetical protein
MAAYRSTLVMVSTTAKELRYKYDRTLNSDLQRFMSRCYARMRPVTEESQVKPKSEDICTLEASKYRSDTLPLSEPGRTRNMYDAQISLQ